MGEEVMDASLAYALDDNKQHDSRLLAMRGSLTALRASPPWTAPTDVFALFCFR